jgi:AbrB family looped-hinge helix DNA binding protein
MGPQGRVVIPADMRRALGLTEGSVLTAVVEGEGRLVLEDRRALVARLRGSWAADDGRSMVDELLEDRRAEAALEHAEVAGDEAAMAAARENLSRAAERHLARPPAR